MIHLKRVIEIYSQEEIEFIKKRTGGNGEGSYYSLPLMDKLDLICKYCNFSSEDKYSITNHARTFFKAHPDKIETTYHGNLTEKDFHSKDGRVNFKKMLDYIATNYPYRKANKVIYDNWIAPNGEYIASNEYRSRFKKESKERNFIINRLDKHNPDSYYAMPTKDKLRILSKYGKFDSEQKYTITNMAKTIYDNNPTKRGTLSKKDFVDINIPKLLDYICKSMNPVKVDDLFYTWIMSYGKDIATREWEDKYSE